MDGQCEKCLVVKNSAPEFWKHGCDCPLTNGERVLVLDERYDLWYEAYYKMPFEGEHLVKLVTGTAYIARQIKKAVYN